MGYWFIPGVGVAELKAIIETLWLDEHRDSDQSEVSSVKLSCNCTCKGAKRSIKPASWLDDAGPYITTSIRFVGVAMVPRGKSRMAAR